MSTDFRRARSPQQREQRRHTILAAARTLLDERPLAEISLRDLSRAVELSTSNVVRYFPTREAVFLAVLTDEWAEWLDAAGQRLDPSGTGDPVARLAAVLGQTLGERPRLCTLLANCTSVLERNVPLDSAREFKAAALTFMCALGDLIRRQLPGLDEPKSVECAGILWVLVAGAWPMAHPTPTVARVLADPSMAPMRVDFVPALSRALTLVFTGLQAQSSPRRD